MPRNPQLEWCSALPKEIFKVSRALCDFACNVDAEIFAFHVAGGCKRGRPQEPRTSLVLPALETAAGIELNGTTGL